MFLAPDALHFADPGVGIEVGCGEQLVAGLFDAVFHPQPVEQRALGLLLTGTSRHVLNNQPQAGRLGTQKVLD